MSRYDGLIIPRSYNDYFSRARPDDMKQFIRTITQSTVDPAGTDPVNGTAVNGALANYSDLNSVNITDCNNDNTPNGKTRICVLMGTITNSPDNTKGWILETSTNLTGARKVQIAKQYYPNSESSQYQRVGLLSNNTWTWTNWEKITTESDLKPTITPITTTNPNVNIVNGGFSKIGNLVVINLRFSVTQANSLITFDTNAPSAISSPKQYIPLNIINIQQDIEELAYGYKQHSTGVFIVKIPRANIEYALSCTYICS